MRPAPRQNSAVASPAPSPTRYSTTSKFEQCNLRWHKDPKRHAHYTDSPTDVELARTLSEMAHDVLRDQASRGPANNRHVELTAVDVACEREWDCARSGAVEGTGAVREQDAERVFRGRRDPERLLEIIVLRIVGAPVTGIIDAHESERRSATLDHMHAVLHEHLPRIPHTANDGVLARVAIVIAQDRDHAQRCMQVAKRAHVVRD